MNLDLKTISVKVTASALITGNGCGPLSSELSNLPADTIRVIIIILCGQWRGQGGGLGV